MRTPSSAACLLTLTVLLFPPGPAFAMHWIGGFKTISVAQDCADFKSEDCQNDLNLPTSREALALGAKCKPARIGGPDRDKAVVAWMIKHRDEWSDEDARSTMVRAGEALWPCPQ